jgi:hypothetical protein
MRETSLVLLAMLTSVVNAGDFSPHVKVALVSGARTVEFSGTLISEDRVLTCNHGFHGMAAPKAFIQFSGDFSIEVPAKVLRQNDAADLALLSFTRPEVLVVQPVGIADSDPKEGDSATAHGYIHPYGPLQERQMRKSDLIYEDDGHSIAHYYGNVESGMSGGGLLSKGKLVGVLSTTTKKPIGGLFASLRDIRNHVK